MNQIEELKKELRTAIADYNISFGCGCCRNHTDHEENEKRIAELLNIPKYEDGSGYDFYQFRSEK